MKTWQIVLVVVLALAVGAAALWIYQSRKALALVAKNRGALGGVVGAVDDAGALYGDLKQIWGNIHT